MGRQLESLVGKRYSKLVIIKYLGTNSVNNRVWECLCDCGGTIGVTTTNLNRKWVQSCGCIKGHNAWKGYEEINHCYWESVRKTAIKRKIEFNLTIEYIWKLYLNQNRRCKLSGLEISFVRNRNKQKGQQTASLDRIDSKKGYVEGNVQWLHKNVNTMKWAFDEKYFLKLCKLITKFNKDIYRKNRSENSTS